MRVRQQLPDGDLRAALHEGARWEPAATNLPPVEPGVRCGKRSPRRRRCPIRRPLAARLEQLLGGSREPFVRRLFAWQLTALGRLYYKNNELDRAGALFETTLGVRPDDAPAAVDLAVVLARRGDYERALSLVEKVLERDPTRETARKRRGAVPRRLQR